MQQFELMTANRRAVKRKSRRLMNLGVVVDDQHLPFIAAGPRLGSFVVVEELEQFFSGGRSVYIHFKYFKKPAGGWHWLKHLLSNGNWAMHL